VHMQQKLGISERRACKVLGQSRSVQRHKPFRSLEQEVLRVLQVNMEDMGTDVLQHY